MQRILEPGQIETFAQRAIPRLRLPDRARVFSVRAERLRTLAADGAIGRAIGDYLRLMASVADAQQAALATLEATLPDAAQIAQARTHRMPLVHATAWPRETCWREALTRLCDAVTALPDLPDSVRVVVDRLSRAQPEQIELEADALLATQGAPDAAAAPFLMAALQVYWVDIASRLAITDVASLDVAVVCPVCGTAPVASVVRTDPRSQGFRYLCCALCAAEWHMVRVTCSHCQGTKGIVYHSIEGGSQASRAECCDSCRTYRKIFYQEHDGAVEPVADDLASLSLDLLLSEAGYHRASGNPLLWGPSTS
jgi:FdhE protein